jgi:hypothetical protein
MKFLESIKDLLSPAPSKVEKQRESMRAHQAAHSVRIETDRARRCARKEQITLPEIQEEAPSH